MADVVGYLRVSTAAQAEGMGLDVQRAGILAWCEANGHHVGYWCTDAGESGSLGLEDRPQLATAMGILTAGAAPGGLIVFRLDRLARDLVLQETLIAEIRTIGSELHSCSPSEDEILRDDSKDPSRKLIRQILGAVAEYERAMIRLRMQAGKAAKQAAGGYIGGNHPYGWIPINGELVPQADEQDVLRGIWGLLDAGYSYRKVAAELNARRIPPRTGDLWAFGTIRKIKERGRRPVETVRS